MAHNSSYVSTREFSELTGIARSTVNRLLREGKIKGVKTAGKWKMAKSEIQAKVIQSILKPSSKAMTTQNGEARGAAVPAGDFVPEITEASIGISAGSARTYSVTEFSDLTYLTVFGVLEFLKKGLLQGVRDEKGNWRLSVDNLHLPGLRHLIR
jgi:excisionase family DNA binding protein